MSFIQMVCMSCFKKIYCQICSSPFKCVYSSPDFFFGSGFVMRIFVNLKCCYVITFCKILAKNTTVLPDKVKYSHFSNKKSTIFFILIPS